MTPFRFEREFQTLPEVYWRVFFDEECTRAQYELLAVRSYEVLELRDTEDTFTRSVRIMPHSNLPPVVRQVFGSRMAYVETTVWHKHEGHADMHVIPSTLAGKTTIRGRHTVRALDPGRILRVFAGEIEVRVPLIGQRLERLVVAQMQESYQKTGELTSACLARAMAAPVSPAAPDTPP